MVHSLPARFSKGPASELSSPVETRYIQPFTAQTPFLFRIAQGIDLPDALKALADDLRSLCFESVQKWTDAGSTPDSILAGLEVRSRLDNAVPSLSATIKTNPAKELRYE